tara:strand:+ start:348 stop:800 length:453 start_codon:yes stop_codon:yes gene_type:complete
MKKKSLAAAIILPVLFGGLGLFYSSTSAAIRMIIFFFVIGLITAISLGYSALIYPWILSQPFIILWSVHIVKKQNEAIDKNESYSNDSAVNAATDMIIPSMICVLFTLIITALTGQFTESNIFANNYGIFYTLLTIITIALSIIPEKSQA